MEYNVLEEFTTIVHKVTVLDTNYKFSKSIGFTKFYLATIDRKEFEKLVEYPEVIYNNTLNTIIVVNDKPNTGIQKFQITEVIKKDRKYINIKLIESNCIFVSNGMHQDKICIEYNNIYFRVNHEEILKAIDIMDNSNTVGNFGFYNTGDQNTKILWINDMGIRFTRDEIRIMRQKIIDFISNN